MGHEAFGVDLAALGLAEQGVREAVESLGENGISSVAAKDGRGLAQGINELAADIGGQALPEALEHFGDKWEWGVRYLVDDGVAAADALRDTRSTYEKAEAGAIDAFQYALHATLGNPMEDSAAWQDKSAGEVVGELTPDYSFSSFTESYESTAQQWEGVTGWDINDDGTTGQQGG